VVSVDLARSGATARPHGADRWLDAAAATAGCRLDERITDSTISLLHVTEGLARRWVGMLTSLRGHAGKNCGGWPAVTSVMVFVAVATALTVPAASAAPPTSRWIVTIAPAADPTAVARSVGAQSVRAYTSAMTGFAATLTEQQVSALGADSRVESLKRDETVATLPRRTEPRARGPVAPSTQFIPEGVCDGSGGCRARPPGSTAAINGSTPTSPSSTPE
jgi:hypothetical protein